MRWKRSLPVCRPTWPLPIFRHSFSRLWRWWRARPCLYRLAACAFWEEGEKLKEEAEDHGGEITQLCPGGSMCHVHTYKTESTSVTLRCGAGRL